MYEYVYPKKTFKKEEVDYLQVIFDNGDFLTISGQELVDVNIKLYDKLIWDGKGVSPVAESGFLKFEIKNTVKNQYRRYLLYNENEFNRDRKGYIENRCQNGIRCIKLFDDNNWHDVIFGIMVGEMDGKYLIIKLENVPNFGGCDSKFNSVFLPNIYKRSIDRICLDFENCDSFTVHSDEILDVNLIFENTLEWGSSNLIRKIKQGYLKFKLDKEIYYREVHLYKYKNSIKQLQERICGKKGRSHHDICHLYVRYKYAGFCETREERISIYDIRPAEEIEMLEQLAEQKGEYYEEFISGYAELLEDGTIIITFGEDAKNLIEKLKK